MRISSSTQWVWLKQNKRIGAGNICCKCNALHRVFIKHKKEKAEQQVGVEKKLSFSCKTKFITSLEKERIGVGQMCCNAFILGHLNGE